MEQGLEFHEESSKDAQENSVKQIILSKLLDSVKQCQNEFGARNELATTENAKVNFLLLQLESVFVHGLKKKLSFLHNDVTDFVNRFLPVDSASSISSSVWSVLKRIMISDHELEMYSKFNHVTCDAGFVRGWIRMVLNEKSLRRQIDTLISSPLIGEYYEPWAFIRDTEMVSALGQMATGLQSILFALKTNDPQLNAPPNLNFDYCNASILTTAVLYSESSTNKHRIPHPILNLNSAKDSRHGNDHESDNRQSSPTRGKKLESDRVKKAFKKPLINFVSFDSQKCLNEKDCQMKVVLPSRSHSLSSPIVSGTFLKTPPNSQSQPSPREEHCQQESPNGTLSEFKELRISSGLPSESFDSKILYLEKADSVFSDAASSDVFLSLGNLDSSTEHDDEGSCESSSVSFKTSDPEAKPDKFDRCPDNTQLLHLTEQLSCVKSELTCLKEDHQRFVKMYELKMEALKIQCDNYKRARDKSKNDPCSNVGSVPGVSEKGENDGYTDGDLVELYEEKLSQLAQMHGELLELNDYLLKQDRIKSKINEKLKLELISLRGPLPEDLLREPSVFSDSASALSSLEARPLVNIWIPTSFLTGKGTDVHNVYQIYLRIANTEWNVYRRYSEFRKLHLSMCRKDVFLKTNFKFPPKKKFGRKNKDFVDCRRRELEQYLRQVVNYAVQNFPEFSSLAVSRDTVSHLMPFFRP